MIAMTKRLLRSMLVPPRRRRSGVVEVDALLKQRSPWGNNCRPAFCSRDAQAGRLDHGAESPVLSEHSELDPPVEPGPARAEGTAFVGLPLELERRDGHRCTGHERLAVYAYGRIWSTAHCQQRIFPAQRHVIAVECRHEERVENEAGRVEGCRACGSDRRPARSRAARREYCAQSEPGGEPDRGDEAKNDRIAYSGLAPSMGRLSIVNGLRGPVENTRRIWLPHLSLRKQQLPRSLVGSCVR